MTVAAIALGANLGDRVTTLQSAVDRLEELGHVIARSSLYETDPVGYLDQPQYLNAVLLLETDIPADELMRALLAIEADLGRVRTFANAPRAIDLDLILYGDEISDAPEVILPHPRMHERAFVLVPLAEIAPGMRHPRLNRSVAELLATLPDQGGVQKTNHALSPGNEKLS